MRCENCLGEMDQVGILYRVNPKGEKGRWRCEACMAAPPDADLKAVTEQIRREGPGGSIPTIPLALN